MGLWSGIFKTDILGAERMCCTVEDIKDCETKNTLLEAYNIGRNIYSELPLDNIIMLGICKMIGELQQEVSNLKSQLNTIGKNI